MLPLSTAIKISLPSDLQTSGPGGGDMAGELAQALVSCDVDVVKVCLDMGVDPDLNLPGGHTPITYLISSSVSENWVDIVRVLLEGGASAQARNQQGTPILCLFAASGQGDLIDLALDKGADINARGVLGETPLLTAVHYKQIECLQVLLRRGADPNTSADDGNSALLWAAGVAAGRRMGVGMHSSLSCVILLLQHGASPTFQNPRGFTPLMAASVVRETATVHRLLRAGADPNARDAQGETALIKAVDGDAEKVVRELLESNIDVNAQNFLGNSALMNAVSICITTQLLQHNADPTLAANDGNTALHYHAMGDRAESALALLEYGASIDARNQCGNTALQVAVSSRSHSVTELLLDSGADAASVNDQGVSLLQDAILPWDYYRTHNIFSVLNTHTLIAELLYYVRSGGGFERSYRICEKLIRAGANVHHVGDVGITALMLAAACGHDQLVRLFLEKGADTSACDASGRNALAYACKWGHEDVVYTLVSHDCPVNNIDTQNNLPIYYAAQYSHVNITVDLMIQLAFYICSLNTEE